MSCGMGTKIRKRRCLDTTDGTEAKKGKDCLGPDTHEDNCDEGKCKGILMTFSSCLSNLCQMSFFSWFFAQQVNIGPVSLGKPHTKQVSPRFCGLHDKSASDQLSKACHTDP